MEIFDLKREYRLLDDKIKEAREKLNDTHYKLNETRDKLYDTCELLNNILF